MMRIGRWTAPLALLVLASPVAGQDGNIVLPVAEIEERLREHAFEIVDRRESRGLEGERTSRAALQFEDGTMMVVKWAPAARGGETFNNQPRYEVAAYEVQKLFLDEPDYVVPPTVVRAFPLAWYQRIDPRASATLRNTSSVLVTIQYWLFNVTQDGVWSEERFAADTAYARHFADLNILTYLIKHNDANEGNLLVSRDVANPRVFAVDNGLAFGSVTSDRGATWRDMQVRRLPAATVARLRAITEEELRAVLETVAQFEVGDDGILHPVRAAPSFSRGRGVRRHESVVQLGLTEREIRETWRRLESLIRDVDRGRYELF